MIHLKLPPCPSVLTQHGPTNTQRLWTAWHGQLPIQPSQRLYGGTVKHTLRTAQGGKCAYCECKLPRDHAQVEHYRPKKGWRQSGGDALNYPGYFWLSYSWGNLYFSCDMCNDAGHKGNVFPLLNPANRAHPGSPSVANEEPLLLSPFIDNPDDHIEWHNDMPSPKANSPRGRATIDIFHLDKDHDLIIERRTYFNTVKSLLEAAENNPFDTFRIALLRAFILDDAPWAGMVRANFMNQILAL